MRLDSDQIVDESQKLFGDSIEYYAGGERTPRALALFATIDKLGKTSTQVCTNLSDSYWETFNFGSQKRFQQRREIER